MKTKFWVVFTGLFIFSIAGPAKWAIADNITIQAVHGKSYIYLDKKSSPIEAKENLVLEPGSRIETEENSFVDIISDYGSFRIHENSIVILNSTLFESSSLKKSSPGKISPRAQLEIITGDLLLKIKKINPDTEFKIKGPTGVAAIRGTVFGISAGENMTTVQVHENQVQLYNENQPDQSVLLSAFEKASISPWNKSLLQASGVGLLSESILGQDPRAKNTEPVISTTLSKEMSLEEVSDQNLWSGNEIANAKKELMMTILNAPTAEGLTVSETIKSHPGKIQDIYQIVNSFSQTRNLKRGPRTILEVMVPLAILEEKIGIAFPKTNHAFHEITFEEYIQKYGATARITTTRAAELDAKRKLTEMIHGAIITSSTNVQNYVTQSDTIQISIDGVIRGASIVRTRYYGNGAIRVNVEIAGGPIGEILYPQAGEFAKSYLTSPTIIDISALDRFQNF